MIVPLATNSASFSTCSILGGQLNVYSRLRFMCDAVDKPVDIAFAKARLKWGFRFESTVAQVLGKARFAPLSQLDGALWYERRALCGTPAVSCRGLAAWSARRRLGRAGTRPTRLIPSVCKSASATLCRPVKQYKADNGGGQLAPRIVCSLTPAARRPFSAR